MDAYDKYDHEFCGTEKPYPVISEGPRLVMVFSSGELQGRGFKVRLIQLISSWNYIEQFSIRENTPSRPSIKSLERQHQMARVASRIEVRQKRKANLTHHDILPTIHPTQTVPSCFLQRLTSRLRLFSITLKWKLTMQIQQVVLTGRMIILVTPCGWLYLINQSLIQPQNICLFWRLAWNVCVVSRWNGSLSRSILWLYGPRSRWKPSRSRRDSCRFAHRPGECCERLQSEIHFWSCEICVRRLRRKLYGFGFWDNNIAGLSIKLRGSWKRSCIEVM